MKTIKGRRRMIWSALLLWLLLLIIHAFPTMEDQNRDKFLMKEYIKSWYEGGKQSVFSLVSMQNTQENGIMIRGDEAFIHKTQAALKLLQNQSKQSYEVVSKYIQKIERSAASGMDVYQNKPTFYVGTDTWTASVTWYASAIVHDAFHAKQYKDFKDKFGESVPNEVFRGYDAEMFCLGKQIEALREMRAPKEEILYAVSLQGSDWWSGKIDW